MHDAAFAAAGIDARYELLELEADAVPDAVAAARGPDWLGLGVTAPYKRLVAGLSTRSSPTPSAIGAVNNVDRTADGRLVGFNTRRARASAPASSSPWAGRCAAPRSWSPARAARRTRSCSPA